MSRDMRFPTMWYVRPAKAQISLRIRAVWSEPLLIAWIFYECLATDRTAFGVSKLKRRLHRHSESTLGKMPLLEISCRASNEFWHQSRATTPLQMWKKWWVTIQTLILSIPTHTRTKFSKIPSWYLANEIMTDGMTDNANQLQPYFFKAVFQ